MKKVISVLMAALVLVCSASVCGAAQAAPRASDYLNKYEVYIAPGDESGTVDISISVKATGKMTKVGAYMITIYNGSGGYVTTVIGSLSNDLIANNVSSHSTVYNFQGRSGTSYYAEVTVYAENSSGSDSAKVITDTVTAP